MEARITAVFRAESGRALATIARLAGDLGVAEDAVQEAFVVALRRWPGTGLPDNPGAWITTTARNRALDVLRRESRRPAREEAAGRAALEATPPILHPVADDQLRLMFTCCHPALAADARITLTLRLVCGLRVPEIARALLQGEEAVGKRLQRAKAKIRDAGIPLRVPPVELLPAEPGAEALLALLLLQDSRRATRLDDAGHVVLLSDQDRSRWDHDRIVEGLAWLDRAGAHRRTISAGAAAYLLQAAIAAEHARAPHWDATDWPTIVALYDQLLELTGSPVVAVNRAVAVSFADGPDVALPLLERFSAAGEPLARSHLLHAARADVRRRLGRTDEAAQLYRLALDCAATEPERALLRRRLAELAELDG